MKSYFFLYFVQCMFRMESNERMRRRMRRFNRRNACVDACVHWYFERVGFARKNFFLRNNQVFRSGSVKVETIFSEMSILYSKQRTNLTLEHGNQRLCLSNHSKNKRKLVDLCAERGIKFQKLSETLFIRRDTDGNIIQQI